MKRATSIDCDSLRRLYITEQKTMKECEEFYAVSSSTIRNRLIEYGIPIRSKSRAQHLKNSSLAQRLKHGRKGEDNGNYRHGGCVQERIYRKMIEFLHCVRCGKENTTLVIHHKNNDHYDNHLENLEPLCRSCHFSHHKYLYWARQRLGRAG